MEKLNLKIPMILISLPASIMGMLLPYYTLSLGLSALQTTGLFSIFSCFLLVARVAIGKWSDQTSRKRIFLLGVVGYALAYGLLGIAKSLPLLYIARGAQACAAVFVSISSSGMIADTCPDKQGNAFGQVDQYTSLGGLLGIGLCFITFRSPDFVIGWYYTFLCCAAAAVVAFVYSIREIPKTEPLNKPEQHTSTTSLPIYKQYLIVNGIACSLTSMISILFVLYVGEVFDAGLDEIAIVFLLPMVLMTYLSPKLGNQADRIGYKKAIGIGFIVAAMGVAGLPFVNSLKIFALIWCIYLVGVKFFGVALSAAYLRKLNPEQRGIQIGIYSSAGTVGAMIGPLLGGILFDRVTMQSPFILGAIVFGILGFIIFLYPAQKVEQIES